VPEPLTFRAAARADLAAIVGMLAADPLGATRESVTEPLAPEYEAAFAAIRDDPNNELLVAECGTALAGVLQLTYLPSLTYRGGWRAQVEGVRVAEGMRGQGVGRALLEEAIARARGRGCRLVQLTTDNRRPEALRFYEQLGFRATHAGMKLQLGR
jgi:GNAT superfamily N-acetyltransferase